MLYSVVLVMAGGHTGHCIGHFIGHPIPRTIDATAFRCSSTPARPGFLNLIEEASKFLVVLELSTMRGAAKYPRFEAEGREIMKVSPSEAFARPQFR